MTASTHTSEAEHDRLGRLSIVQSAFVASLGLSAVSLGASFRLTDFSRLTYLSTAALVYLIAFEEIRRRQVSQRQLVAAVWVHIGLFAFIFPQLRFEELRWLLVVGDFTQLAVLAVIAIVPRPFLALLRSPTATGFIVAAMTVAAILGPTVAVERGRYNPPQYLLIALVVVLLSQRGRPGLVRFAALASGLALITLTFGSGNRLAFLGAVIALAYALVLRFSVRGRIALVVALLALASIAAPTIADFGADLAEGTRFEALATGRLDESSAGRLDEARDVLGRVDEEWTTLNFVFGEGHGAQYQPVLSTTIEKTREDGLFHAVHIGLLRYFFRYGFIGLAIAAVAQLRLLYRILIARHQGLLAANVLLVAGLMTLADNQVRNSLLDPANVVILGLLLSGSALGSRPQQPTAQRNSFRREHRGSRHRHRTDARTTPVRQQRVARSEPR